MCVRVCVCVCVCRLACYFNPGCLQMKRLYTSGLIHLISFICSAVIRQIKLDLACRLLINYIKTLINQIIQSLYYQIYT